MQLLTSMCLHMYNIYMHAHSITFTYSVIRRSRLPIHSLRSLMEFSSVWSGTGMGAVVVMVYSVIVTLPPAQAQNNDRTGVTQLYTDTKQWQGRCYTHTCTQTQNNDKAGVIYSHLHTDTKQWQGRYYTHTCTDTKQWQVRCYSHTCT